MATLRDQLYNIREQSFCRGERRNFYPTPAVERLLTSQEMSNAVSCIPFVREDQVDLYVSLIKENSLKIFAILLLNGDQRHILQFLYRREQDGRIPYDENDLRFLPPAVAGQFAERQWEFDPVLLVKHEIHREIKEKEVLPFLAEEYLDSGCFGQVYKVKLYRGHQRLVPESRQQVSLTNL